MQFQTLSADPIQATVFKGPGCKVSKEARLTVRFVLRPLADKLSSKRVATNEEQDPCCSVYTPTVYKNLLKGRKTTKYFDYTAR